MSRTEEARPTVEGGDEPLIVVPEAAASPGRRRWRWLALPLGAAALAAGAVGFSHSGFFSAEHIKVIGATHLPAQQVIRESGVTSQTNVLYLDPTEVEARLSRDPWIARSTVATALPHTVTIAVVERVAVAEIDRNGLHSLVSDTGSILGTQTKDPRLPVLLSSEATTAGPPITVAARALAAMSADLRHQVVSASVDDAGEVTLLLRRHIVVTYGTVSDVAAKATSLDVMLAWGASHHKRFDSIDVTSPDAPAARLVGGSAVQP